MNINISQKTSALTFKEVELKLPTMEYPLLENLNFSIYPNDIVILLGANGSGKSSLLKLMQNQYSPTKGSISLKGKPLSAFTIQERAKDIINLTQDLSKSLFENLSVLENCLLWELRQKNLSLTISTKQEALFYKEYLTKFHHNLSQKLHTNVNLLSGGEKQCLVLALCLRFPPHLMLFDEHTSALDPLKANEIMSYTAEMLERESVTSVITTHNLDHALRYGNRLLALRGGKIILDADQETKLRLQRQDLLELYC